ncbi:MAG TPA: hypothetical protein VKH43_13320 [Thermoanaerobaculia bacterium]|nr:hypothetical protein [Thermoanaerobaculia bacterium]
MKAAQAATFESALVRVPALSRRETGIRGFAWALLAAEVGAAFVLFSSDLVPSVVIRSLQVFLRF